MVVELRRVGSSKLLERLVPFARLHQTAQHARVVPYGLGERSGCDAWPVSKGEEAKGAAEEEGALTARARAGHETRGAD